MKRADYLPVLLGKTLGAYYYDQVPQDVRQWSVYAAEESLKPGVAFATEDEARLFLENVLSSDVWCQQFPLMRQVDLSVVQKAGAEAAGPAFSRGGPTGDNPLRSAEIEIHEDMLNEMVLLHELAHCVQPRYFGRIAPVSPDPFDAPPSEESGHGHDPYFQATYVWLCEHFGTTTTHTELKEAYTHFGYPPVSEESLWEMQKRNEYWAPLEVARRAKIREALARDKPEFTAAYPELAAKAADMAAQQVDRIPMGCRFGDLFMDLREFSHRVPKKRAAEIVSRVVPCKTSDLTRLEGLSHPPEDLRDQRLAVYYAVALGADPIWARTGFGVTRLRPRVLMKDLIKINRPWVMLVRTMNRQLQQRPSHWRGTGPR